MFVVDYRIYLVPKLRFGNGKAREALLRLRKLSFQRWFRPKQELVTEGKCRMQDLAHIQPLVCKWAYLVPKLRFGNEKTREALLRFVEAEFPKLNYFHAFQYTEVFFYGRF